MTKEQKIVELCLYSKMSYRQLAESPLWFIQILEIRKAEEAEYSSEMARKK